MLKWLINLLKEAKINKSIKVDIKKKKVLRIHVKTSSMVKNSTNNLPGENTLLKYIIYNGLLSKHKHTNTFSNSYESASSKDWTFPSTFMILNLFKNLNFK